MLFLRSLFSTGNNDEEEIDMQRHILPEDLCKLSRQLFRFLGLSPIRSSTPPAWKNLEKILRVSMISLNARKFSTRHVNSPRYDPSTAGRPPSHPPGAGSPRSGGGSDAIAVSFRISTSAEKTTVSFTRNPESWSKRAVSVMNSRQPQSFAALE